MSVNLVIAVTDGEWHGLLRQRPPLGEVNFWSPSPRMFRALRPGELFLFKLHSPRGFIVGGGVFAHASTLPCSLAWEAFGEGNGARSALEMRARIARYRRVLPGDRSDFVIGCRILTQPFFLDERDWIEVPPSWSRNIVQFKTYATGEPEGTALWDALQRRIARSPTVGADEDRARYGPPRVVRPRLGQGGFRVLVTDICARRCAVTQERTLPALEAAHIRPYAEGGTHEARNGLLLRRDLHSLFDAGYIAVTPDLRVEVSRRIREEFDNGRHYYAMHGGSIHLPADSRQRPDAGALAWHNEHCFRG